MNLRRTCRAGLLAALFLLCGLVSRGQAAGPAKPPADAASAGAVVPWTRLQKVRLIEDNNKTQPEFDPSVASLDGQEVTIEGFIMPLDQGEKQKHFLISPYPQTCPFCSPFGPEGLIEVVCREAIPLTFKAITLKGRFGLLRNYDETGLFYRLNDASPVN